MRQRLLGDKDLSVQLVDHCQKVLNGKCAPGLTPANGGEGIVISCLMQLAANGSEDISSQCMQDVSIIST